MSTPRHAIGPLRRLWRSVHEALTTDDINGLLERLEAENAVREARRGEVGTVYRRLKRDNLV